MFANGNNPVERKRVHKKWRVAGAGKEDGICCTGGGANLAEAKGQLTQPSTVKVPSENVVMLMDVVRACRKSLLIASIFLSFHLKKQLGEKMLET